MFDFLSGKTTRGAAFALGRRRSPIGHVVCYHRLFSAGIKLPDSPITERARLRSELNTVETTR